MRVWLLALLLLLAPGSERWPDSRLAPGIFLFIFFLRASRENLILSFAPGIQTIFFFALRAKD